MGAISSSNSYALLSTLGASTSDKRLSILRPFWAGLANRSFSPCDVLLVGDSVTEGRGATNSQDGRCWFAKFRDGLRSRYQPSGITGGEGYVASWCASPNRTTRFALVGSWTSQGTIYGFGRRHIRSFTSGDTATLTFTGTAVDIYWTQIPGDGSFSWAVDGGGATTVGTSGASIVGGKKTSITGLVTGSHSLVITWVSGAFTIEGAFVMDGDESAGIRVTEGGHSGFTSGNYVDTSNPHWIDCVTTLQPKLVCIGLGFNDLGGGVAISAFQSNMQTLVANIRAACTISPTIVISALYPRGDFTAAQWLPYWGSLRNVAIGDGNLLFHDVQARFGTDIVTNTYSLISDTVHPSDKGHQFYADSLVDLVSP